MVESERRLSCLGHLLRVKWRRKARIWKSSCLHLQTSRQNRRNEIHNQPIIVHTKQASIEFITFLYALQFEKLMALDSQCVCTDVCPS
jgi:hypothetical protein